MKAVTLDAFDRPPRLRDDLPAPTPAPNEVLVRVHASSVNPADNGIAAGMLKQMGLEYEFPVILGQGPGRTMIMATPTPENLEHLARLLADGTLRVPIQATHELAQAPDALAALPTTHTLGKVAIRVP
jgi:NADPH:quinone reductase-like Zn-dependent oxidoreductase